jgi:hypothetical protein
MTRNPIRLAIIIVLALAVLLAVLVGIRSASQAPPPSPTADIPAVQTHAVATFSAALTSTAVSAPTSTRTPAPSATPTPLSSPTGRASTGSPGAGSPTSSCNRLTYLQDITIPDYTVMTPAQVFTKTWQVENSGTCPWRAGFKLILVGGVAMGGSPYVVPAAVNPGAKLDLSIKMAAPTNQAGLVQGTWRMTDENGAPFGDALTVVIVIGGGSGTPAGAAPTGTP